MIDKPKWEILRDEAARQYEQDVAKPKPVSVLDLARLLDDGFTITDPAQFKWIAHSLICMDAALNESKATISKLRLAYREERKRSLGRYKLAVERKRRIRELEAELAAAKKERG